MIFHVNHLQEDSHKIILKISSLFLVNQVRYHPIFHLLPFIVMVGINSSPASHYFYHLLLSSAYVHRLPILQTLWTLGSCLIRVHSFCLHDTIESEANLNIYNAADIKNIFRLKGFFLSPYLTHSWLTMSDRNQLLIISLRLLMLWLIQSEILMKGHISSKLEVKIEYRLCQWSNKQLNK